MSFIRQGGLIGADVNSLAVYVFSSSSEGHRSKYWDPERQLLVEGHQHVTAACERA